MKHRQIAMSFAYGLAIFMLILLMLILLFAPFKGQRNHSGTDK